MPRRERATILAALLSALDASEGAPVGITRVALRANLPHDRTAAYLDELTLAGLVTPGRTPVLTEEGREALRAYREWASVMERFGLD